jgi:hypothetical protein
MDEGNSAKAAGEADDRYLGKMIEIKTGVNEQRMQTFQEMMEARQEEFKDHFYMKAERSVAAFLVENIPSDSEKQKEVHEESPFPHS